MFPKKKKVIILAYFKGTVKMTKSTYKAGDIYQDRDGWTVMLVIDGGTPKDLRAVCIGRPEDKEFELYLCHFSREPLDKALSRSTYLGNFYDQITGFAHELYEVQQNDR